MFLHIYFFLYKIKLENVWEQFWGGSHFFYKPETIDSGLIAPPICLFGWKSIGSNFKTILRTMIPAQPFLPKYAEHGVTQASFPADISIPGKEKLWSECAKFIEEKVYKAWWRHLLSLLIYRKITTGGGVETHLIHLSFHSSKMEQIS